MFNRVIKSVSFGITFALAMLFSHQMKPTGRMSAWLETSVRFFVATAAHLLVSVAVDSVRSKLKERE